MYLPALPALTGVFSTDAGRVQLSLASFFFGFSIGQTFYGPITDRFGRKRPLYGGLFLFAAASLGCALTTSIDALIFLRFLQALGACSGQVIARAIVRDLFEPKETVVVFSTLMLVIGLAPMLAPIAGGQIMTLFGWRAIFWILMSLGCAAVVAVALRLPETHRSNPARRISLGRVLAGYRDLLAHRKFVGYALTGGLGMAGMFAYIAGSPFVFIELFDVPASRFGLFFGANAFGFILVSQLNIRLARRLEPNTVIKGVLTIQTLAGLLLIAGTATGLLGLYGTAVLLFAYIASLGCLAPNTTAMAMASQSENAGSASALLGTLQFSLAAIAATVVGAGDHDTALPMAAAVAACGATALVLHRVLVMRFE
jgi:DHA1 family bicyclomycin/chloramphenicol resistance-like MFS transporter